MEEANNEKLKQIIELLKQQKQELPENYNEIEKQSKKYKKILINIEKDIFKLLDYTNLLIDVKKENKEYILLIETLGVLKNNTLITLTEEQIQNIRKNKMFTSCISEIKNYEKKYEKELEKIEPIKTKNEIIDEIIKELQETKNLIEKELLNKIYELIINNQITTSTKPKLRNLILEYNIEIYNYIKQKLEQEQQEKIKSRTEKITDEELEKIFNNYGYNYKKVPNELKEKLKIKGNKERIKEVFETIKQYKIDFKENDTISICLLIKSSRKAIEKIMELLKKYNFDFYKAIKKFPSIIMHKLKSQIKTPNPKEGIIEISGSFEDFEENIKDIEKLGYNITQALEETMSIFITPNVKIKRNIEALRQYGFPEKLARIDFKLTGLKGDYITTIIDKFIELGELEYIQTNTSRLILDKESYIFERLYFAQKYNREQGTRYTLKRKYKDKYVLTGIISEEKNQTLNNLINKENITNYVFNEQIDKKIKQYIEDKEKEGFIYEIPNSELISNLDNNYKKDNITYNFEGIIISRLKVLRIYALLEKKFKEYNKEQLLLYAITYTSILDHEEFNKIKNLITKEKTK